MHDDEADPEYEYVPVDLRSPPGWAEAFARTAELVVDESATADDVRRDYGRLATIVVEEFPPSLEREALLERLAAVGGLSTP